ncbi:MAG: RluA family pseudouridine synthase [Hyphomicrobiaceae bacterium]
MTGFEDSVFTVVSTVEEAGERLDRFLARHLAPLSRSRLQAIIAEGGVHVDGEIVVDQRTKVRGEATFTIKMRQPDPAIPKGENIALNIVYEDEDLIVVDKPAGLVVHPGAGHATGTLVNALIAHCGDSLSGIGGVRRPGIVHRLDKDTSGLLVVAKHDMAHQALSEQFAAHGRDGKLSRGYTALVWGQLTPVKGRVDARIGRSKHSRTKMDVVRPGLGRAAATTYCVVDTYLSEQGKEVVVSQLSLQLETGRTHQIRVHMAHIGHPLLGDAVYGSGFKASERHLTDQAQTVLATLNRQALHAHHLGFEHPRSGKVLAFESPLPEDMRNLIQVLKQQNSL